MKTGHEVDGRKRLLKTKANEKGAKLLQTENGDEEVDLCNKLTSLFCHEPNRKVVFNDELEVRRN